MICSDLHVLCKLVLGMGPVIIFLFKTLFDNSVLCESGTLEIIKILREVTTSFLRVCFLPLAQRMQYIKCLIDGNLYIAG